VYFVSLRVPFILLHKETAFNQDFSSMNFFFNNSSFLLACGGNCDSGSARIDLLMMASTPPAVADEPYGTGEICHGETNKKLIFCL
jgi:hypothetical protein